MGEQTSIPATVVPESLTFPQAMLDGWFEHDSGTYLEVAFTRGDWDTLFSSLNNGLNAQAALDQAFVEWSNANTAGANGWLNESRRLRVESSNSLKRFFMAIMSSATRGAKSNV